MHSDMHTYPFNEFSKPCGDGRTTLIQEHENTYDWIANLIEEHSPDIVVNLGDTGHTHGFLDSISATTIYNGDRKISQSCKLVKADKVTLLGNHDFDNEVSRVHNLPFIEDMITVPT